MVREYSVTWNTINSDEAISSEPILQRQIKPESIQVNSKRSTDILCNNVSQASASRPNCIHNLDDILAQSRLIACSYATGKMNRCSIFGLKPLATAFRTDIIMRNFGAVGTVQETWNSHDAAPHQLIESADRSRKNKTPTEDGLHLRKWYVFYFQLSDQSGTVVNCLWRTLAKKTVFTSETFWLRPATMVLW